MEDGAPIRFFQHCSNRRREDLGQFLGNSKYSVTMPGTDKEDITANIPTGSK